MSCLRFQKSGAKQKALSLDEAILFATEKHSGQLRKGTNTPYIVHPLETMAILNSMGAGVDLLVAGLFHDLIEDTDTSIIEIEERFGAEVADLIRRHSENKTESWQERKEKDIQETSNGSRELKMLVMADKVSNLRALYNDYRNLHELVWLRFHAPENKQAWYYSQMIDALDEMQYDESTAGIYWEMVALYKDIFVEFYYDRFTETLYQRSLAGESYILDIVDPEWKEFTDEIPTEAEKIHRKCAERIEDNWTDEFEMVLCKDMLNAEYTWSSSDKHVLSVKLCDGNMEFKGKDFGSECELIHDMDAYAFLYKLDAKQTYKLLRYLRRKYVFRYPIEKVLIQEFGVDNGATVFRTLCDNLNVEYQVFSF